MDLLYVTGKGTGEELRYSLRSVCKNMPHGKVVISGRLPKWAAGVDHVPGEDSNQLRQRNIQGKILAALQSGKVGDHFALMCDDILITAPWKCDAIRHLSTLSKRMVRIRRQRPAADQWRADMERTVKLLDDMGAKDPLDLGTHHPVILERDKAIATLQLIAELPAPVCMVHTYVAMHGAEVVPGFNSKIDRWKGPPADPVVSTGPGVEKHPGFHAWAKGMFPEPCRYERL